MERELGEVTAFMMIAIGYCFDVEYDEVFLWHPMRLPPFRTEKE